MPYSRRTDPRRQLISWLQHFIVAERPSWLRWTASIGLFLLAFVLRYELGPNLPPGFPYLTFFPAVILTTFIGGLWPAITNAVLGGLASWYFFIQPAYSFELNSGAALALAFYLFIVSVDIGIIHSINLTAKRVQKHRVDLETLTRSLQDANAELEKNRAHQTVLSHELGHRMKNQLSMVQAIANQTLRSASDLATAKSVLSERIAVLANAHNLLLTESSNQTTILGIVEATLAVHDNKLSSRFDVSGHDLSIAPRPALSIALILHELSTNAAKYGALSTEAGRVSISWDVQYGDDHANFVMVWEESGGPPVLAPNRVGSGTRLISAGLSGTISSSVDFQYRPEGLLCQIQSDLKSMQTEH